MGTTRHFALVTTTPSQSKGLVYWVCVVLVLSLICVPFVDTRGEVIERFSNKHVSAGYQATVALMEMKEWTN